VQNGSDSFVLKLDANGNFIWARSNGGSGTSEGFGIATDAAGNIYTTGAFSGKVNFNPGSGASYNLTAQGVLNAFFQTLENAFVQKLDSAGNLVWAADLGTGGSAVGFGIALDDSGDVYTTGEFSGTDDFDPTPGQYLLTSAGLDIFVSQLTQPAGTFLATPYALLGGPQIGSFTANPNPVTAGSSVTLTASNIRDANPDTTSTQVVFYSFDSSGTKQILGYGTQTNPGVWSLTLASNLRPGSYTLFSQAEDGYGAFGDPTTLTLTVQ